MGGNQKYNEVNPVTFNHWKSTGGSDVGKELRGQSSIQFIKQACRNYLGTNTKNY